MYYIIIDKGIISIISAPINQTSKLNETKFISLMRNVLTYLKKLRKNWFLHFNIGSTDQIANIFYNFIYSVTYVKLFFFLIH